MSDPENKKLKDLLNEKNREQLDDFEKEALSGFDMLDNERESLDLKAELDTRITREVFNEEKSRKPFFWIAAAAMLLITGLSAYFILLDNEQSVNRQDLAVVAKKDLPENTPGLESSFEAKAAEISAPQTENEVRKKPVEKTKPAVAPEANAVQSTGAINVSEPVTISADMAAAPVSNQQEDERESDDQDKARESFALAKKQEEKEEKAEAVKDKMVASYRRNEESDSKKADRKAKSAAPAAQPAEIEAAPSKSNSGGCDYVGGKEALRKDIEEKLTAKEINKGIEATLLIDKNKVIEVTFFKPVNFSAKELKTVEQILKSLDKFSAFSCLYRLSYQPSN